MGGEDDGEAIVGDGDDLDGTSDPTEEASDSDSSLMLRPINPAAVGECRAQVGQFQAAKRACTLSREK